MTIYVHCKRQTCSVSKEIDREKREIIEEVDNDLERQQIRDDVFLGHTALAKSNNYDNTRVLAANDSDMCLRIEFFSDAKE